MFSITNSIKVSLLTLLVFLLTACDPPSDIMVSCNVQELIDAINDANANLNLNTIILDGGCDYILTQPDNLTVDDGISNAGDGGGNGLPVINTAITIEGNQARIMRSTGSGVPEFRIFYITDPGILTLNNVYVKNGLLRFSHDNMARGGAVYNKEGVLSLNQSSMENNEANGGGGIYNYWGTVIINNSSVNSNNALVGGAINNSIGTVEIYGFSQIKNNSAGTGGAIYNMGELTILDSQVSYNQAVNNGGAIFHYSSSPLIINNVNFEGNTGWSGGAIYNHFGPINIIDSTFDGNHADLIGGGLYNVNGEGVIGPYVHFKNNTAIHGGAIANLAGILIIDNSMVYDNEASSMGGGIYNDGELTIQNSTVKNNVAAQGGGIASLDPLLLIGSTVSGNTATSEGGGIIALYYMEMLNSTISGNQAPSSAGLLIQADPGVIDISFSTISNNISQNGYGGVYVQEGSLAIQNSIVADNQPVNCGQLSSNLIAGHGGNLDTDGSCPGFTLSFDPYLGPLANNGGPTETHSLGMFSPAIDAAPSCDKFGSGGTGINVDQRGEPRPFGVRCDLGAYETQSAPLVNLDLNRITFRMNVNCRIGPHYDHIVVLTYQAGETANAIGRNKDGTWLAAYLPEGEGGEKWCWVPDELLNRDFDKFTLPIFPHLPSPGALEPKDEGSEKEGCWVTPLGGGDPVCTVPCPAGASPGGACKP